MRVDQGRRSRSRRPYAGLVAAAAAFLCAATTAHGQSRTYTTDADFDAGALQQVEHTTQPDQLQLQRSTSQHSFVWIANSTRGTLVRLDAVTGMVLGEYRTSPDGFGRSPSRLAIDAAGNVWAGNRAETAGGRGSVVKVGLVIGGTRGRKDAGGFVPDPAGDYLAPPFRHCTAVDRDGDGLIRTSRGLGHILPWRALTSPLDEPGEPAAAADDECILLYVRTSAPGVHHVSLDAGGHVWVGGYPAPAAFDELDGDTGAILQTVATTCGGYSGLVDENGVLWSSSPDQSRLLRYDTRSGDSRSIPVNASYGVTRDGAGFIWNSMFTNNTFTKIDPSGEIVPGFPKPSFGAGSTGIVVSPSDGDVWLANYNSDTVTRLTSAGVLRKRLFAGNGPNGLCLDRNGKLWLASQLSNSVMRLDPSAGIDGLGAIELTVNLGTGAGPHTFGDLCGDVEVHETAAEGTWTVVYDGERPGLDWGTVEWHGEEPAGTRLAVAVRAADETAELAGRSWLEVPNGVDFRGQGVVGRHIEIRVTLQRGSDPLATPVLHDLSVRTEVNAGPDCSQAHPSVEAIWPPDGRMVDVRILGLVDPDGDPVSYRILRVTQDEPVVCKPGRAWPPFDAAGIGTDSLQLRAERRGDPSGNGRVYEITFVALDSRGGECEGRVTVCVPHDNRRRRHCTDDGQEWDSAPSVTDLSPLDVRQYPNPFNPSTTIEYTLTVGGPVNVTVYDAAGRRLRLLDSGTRAAGVHAVVWDGRDARGGNMPSGLYFLRIDAGEHAETRRMLLVK